MNYRAYEILGNIPESECAIVDNKGHHCQDKVVYYINHNDKEIGLCERCYQNYLNRFKNKNKRTLYMKSKLFLCILSMILMYFNCYYIKEYHLFKPLEICIDNYIFLYFKYSGKRFVVQKYDSTGEECFCFCEKNNDK